ncbi:ComC/BlpC family leader-containing pheromone/bacteriocin, partial [Streptococcus infantarius]
MNTKIFEQFDVMTDAELAKVEGGGMEWIGD